MKKHTFLQAIGEIDPHLVAEAAEPPRRRLPAAVKFAGLAACLLFVAGGGLLLSQTNRIKSEADCIQESPSAMDAILDRIDTITDVEAENSSSVKENSATVDESVEDGSLSADADALSEITFCFYRSGEWLTETVSYPDGLPAADLLVNDYLAACDTEYRCLSVDVEITEAYTEIIDSLVQHTPSFRIAVITLTGDPGEDILRGLVETVRTSDVFSVQSVRLQTQEGPLDVRGLSS